MACRDCQRHLMAAGAYRWLLEQLREQLPHEFGAPPWPAPPEAQAQACAASGSRIGPNAMLGCRRCLAERLLARTGVQGDLTLAALRAPYLEQAAQLLEEAEADGVSEAWQDRRRQVTDGLRRAGKLAEAQARDARARLEAEAAERRQRVERLTRPQDPAPAGRKGADKAPKAPPARETAAPRPKPAGKRPRRPRRARPRPATTGPAEGETDGGGPDGEAT